MRARALLGLSAALLSAPDARSVETPAGVAPAVFEVAPNGAGQAVVTLVEQGDVPPAMRAPVKRWVSDSARSVAGYFGRFPARARVVVKPAPSGAVGRGVTYGRRALPMIRVFLGPDATSRDLARDWVLTHEMVHLAFPSVGHHSWLEEGVAVYVEPVARAKAGVASADDVWRWLVWGLPKGLPDGRDSGLDSADSWGRTYWGGALFCFLADVEIRRASSNRRSIGDALRAILETCGGVATAMPIGDVLDAGDRALERPVLRPLYERLGRAPGAPDLGALFRLLGVDASGGGLRFDDDAPYASIRRALATDGTSSGLRDVSGHGREVPHEAGAGGGAVLLGRRPQHRGRVQRREDVTRERRLDGLRRGADARGGPEKRLRGRRAQQHDGLRREGRELRVEPGPTRRDLA